MGDKINFYVHPEIIIDDRILLMTLLKTDKAYVATVYERDTKDGVGASFIKGVMGEVFAYVDEHPTMEDARPYWSIRYIVTPDYKQSVGKDMERILDVLLSEKMVEGPAWIHNSNEELFKEGDVTDIQRGKIFPDDE